MTTKTANGTRYVNRYFHAETGFCLTESEARRLPGRFVVVETLRVPGKNKNTEVRKPVPQKKKVNQIHYTFSQIKTAIAVFYNRIKQQLTFLDEKKKDHGLFEGENPLVKGLASHFPFAVTRKVTVVNSTTTNVDSK